MKLADNEDADKLKDCLEISLGRVENRIDARFNAIEARFNALDVRLGNLRIFLVVMIGGIVAQIVIALTHFTPI